jgi:hypothetical protein
MATEVKKDVKKVEEKTATEPKGKGLLKIAEVRMLLYVIPVALILLAISLLLKSN